MEDLITFELDIVSTQKKWRRADVFYFQIEELVYGCFFYDGSAGGSTLGMTIRNSFLGVICLVCLCVWVGDLHERYETGG